MQQHRNTTPTLKMQQPLNIPLTPEYHGSNGMPGQQYSASAKPSSQRSLMPSRSSRRYDGTGTIPEGLRLVHNPLAIAEFIFYVLSLLAYLGVRINDTVRYMEGASKWLSVAMLGVEVVGAFALIPYALANCRHVRPALEAKKFPDYAAFGCPPGSGYHVFILVPCYKENWTTIVRTIKRAHAAKIPPGCIKHIILCDDGWDQGSGPDDETSPNRREQLLRVLEMELYLKYTLENQASDFGPSKLGRHNAPLWFHKLHISQRDKKRFDTKGRSLPGRIPGNGKSLNLNHCLHHVVPHILSRMDELEQPVHGPELPDLGLPGPREWHRVPAPEVDHEQLRKCAVVVLDCDMAIKTDTNEYHKWNVPPKSGDGLGFLPKVLRLLMRNRWLDLVLTPQSFTNVDYFADIYNHINHQFWHYILPGLTAMGYIACTGTNMAFRLSALLAITPSRWRQQEKRQNPQSAEYEHKLQSPFPTTSVTEDFGLSLRMIKRGMKGTYYAEALVEGEAPEGIRKVDIQRGRWTEGHWQIFFSKRNPFFSICKLGLRHAILYNYGTLAYLCNLITIWFYTAVPILTSFDMFPVYVSNAFRIVATLYLVSIFLVQNYVHDGKHSLGMWFANMSNILLSWTFTKAILRAVMQSTEFAIHTKPAAAAPAPTATITTTLAPASPHPLASAPPAFKSPSGKVPPFNVAAPMPYKNGMPSPGGSHDGQVVVEIEAQVSEVLTDGVFSDAVEFNPPAPELPQRDLEHSPFYEIWDHVIYFSILAIASIGAMGLSVWKMIRDKRISASALLPFLWAGYNVIGPFLFFVCALVKTAPILSRAAISLSQIQTLCAVTAVVTMWFINHPVTLS